jgi:hypothetical protein
MPSHSSDQCAGPRHMSAPTRVCRLWNWRVCMMKCTGSPSNRPNGRANRTVRRIVRSAEPGPRGQRRRRRGPISAWPRQGRAPLGAVQVATGRPSGRWLNDAAAREMTEEDHERFDGGIAGQALFSWPPGDLGPAPRLTFLRRLGPDLSAATAGARSAVAESGEQVLYGRLPPRLNLELPVLG